MLNVFIELLNYFYKIEHKSINFVLIIKYIIKIIELLKDENNREDEALILQKIYNENNL